MADGASRGPTPRQVAAVVCGNALEFYDFVTYSFFATQIGHALFPGDADQKLILSLATFGIGFVTRPLGGFVIGGFADRRGSTPSILLFVEALPARIRAGGMGIVYALAIGVFGGTAQLLNKKLIDWTGSPIAPGWYMAAAIAMGLAGTFLIKEARRPSPPPPSRA